MLPPFWRNVTLINPVVYLVNGFRWSFFGRSDVAVGVSLGMTIVFSGSVPDRRHLDFPHRLPAARVMAPA